MLAVRNVLFVEDNELAALAGAEMLKSFGYDVLHVLTAEEGLQAFQNRAFDLVLSDVCLPGRMDGVELATTIRRYRPETPIILITGYSERAEAARREFVVLQKPYDMTQFRTAMQRLAGEAGG